MEGKSIVEKQKVENNTSLHIKSEMARWQVKMLGFQKMKDILSGGK